MGCDGGTIPTRDELVRKKRAPEQKDRNAEMAAKWKYCCISQERLRQPIVSCELGRLYNKDKVIEFLLDRSQFEMTSNFSHLRTLKDVKELRLTDNPDAMKSKAENGDGYIDAHTSEYICPITGLEMSGRYGFDFVWTCGCVMSERALKEVKGNECHVCGKPYNGRDIISINANDEEIAELRAGMERRRAAAKISKKPSKSGSKHKTEIAEPEPSCSGTKQAKYMTQSSDETVNCSATAPGVTSTKLASNSTKTQPDNPKIKSRTAHGAGTRHSKVVTSSAPKGGIQNDPSASKAYKSLFTSSSAAKSQMAPHWVTFNPMYY